MTDTAVPPIQFLPTGLFVPAQSAVLAGVQSDLNSAFGGRLNFGTPTQPGGAPPQVQQSASYAALISNKNTLFAQFVAQADPINAQGFMQDAIGLLYFLLRNPGLPTVVQLPCIGAAGTPLPAGVAQAQDTSGNIYICQQTGTIPVSGTITLPFANALLGPIPCPPNTIVNVPYSQINGWDSVSNPNAGVLGALVESQSEFEFRRQQTVAANSNGGLPAIYGSVFKVPNVIDVYAFQNNTNAPIFVGSTNFELIEHSIYVAVVGGDSQAIAQAIWDKKDPGCDMVGNTTETVLDTSGYSFPQPSYPITFNRNASTPYNFIVDIVDSASLPSTIVADAQAAIAAQFSGTNGGQRVRIGSLLLASTFYGPVATCEGPSVPVQVLSITIGSVFVGTGTTEISSNVLTVVTLASGSVSPGTVVTAADVPNGTTIVGQLTGADVGGTGTYLMSAEAGATHGSPEAITGAGGTAQLIGIDQSPVLGSVTINLV